MKELLLILILVLSFTFSKAQNALENKIQNLSIDSAGNVTWTSLNEKDFTVFEVQEFRWGRWEKLEQINGKGIGNNFYAYRADTSCGMYSVRIQVIENWKSTSISNHVNYPIKEDIHFVGCGDGIRLNKKTMFEVYDKDSALILSGCDSKVNISNLKKGIYILNFADRQDRFIKK